ncbi:hypothetical protein [Azohydromonas aeria]|uniref:hypothetical protein n=1 Tax=Azohydromonas aeria TaxID=2590212 RepID=UPI0012F7F48E|nr:hypothetical protein [Azohydromonas aeria]
MEWSYFLPVLVFLATALALWVIGAFVGRRRDPAPPGDPVWGHSSWLDTQPMEPARREPPASSIHPLPRVVGRHDSAASLARRTVAPQAPPMPAAKGCAAGSRCCGGCSTPKRATVQAPPRRNPGEPPKPAASASRARDADAAGDYGSARGLVEFGEAPAPAPAVATFASSMGGTFGGGGASSRWESPGDACSSRYDSGSSWSSSDSSSSSSDSGSSSCSSD